ncbi:pyridine nucleotide-disulfide oxidoreductase, partial [Arthrobacter sp. I2-34]|nr:pyridine nucleotide-disulfide oxidoreductase [Arthrobacter hankyongi]
TIGCLLEDRPELPAAANPDEDAIIALLRERGVEYTTWQGWLRLDAHELSLGASFDGGEDMPAVARERIKVVPRAEMVEISRDQAAAAQRLT